MGEDVRIPSGLINAIVAGYQIALNRLLGAGGSAAMTQMLIRDIGDMLEEMLEEVGFDLGGEADLKDTIPKAFEMLGISRDVEVEEAEGKYVIRIKDSVFKPTARLLESKGIKFTLSPESFLAAAIARKAIRKTRPDAQVKIRVHPQRSADDPLVVEVILR